MARPRKCRRICGLPAVTRFEPVPAGGSQPIVMTVDEYEAIRLMDLLGCTQEDCARQMGVARTTVQAVYDTARQKLAQALVLGQPLVIDGGDYTLCERAAGCCGKNCRRRQCGGNCCGSSEKGGNCVENCSNL